MQDQLGNALKVGDRARVTAIHAGRGAYSDRVGACTVVAIKRTRAEVQCDGFLGTNIIGSELLRVIVAVDGRDLLTLADVDVFAVGILKPGESYPALSARQGETPLGESAGRHPVLMSQTKQQEETQ